ncbi:MAG: metal ABC transporter permease, partial [Phycisphaerales bacterium]|nr:metal ABC transporter permease [Phycisphaerales bacterium]
MTAPLPNSAALTTGSLTDAGFDLPAWDEVARIMTFRGGMNTSTVIAGTSLLGLAAGVIGVFALLRKRALVADALSHATLPGIVLAFLAAVGLGFDGRSLPVLMAGAVGTGVLGVLCIQLLVRHTRLHEDAAIGVVLSVFFGAGVVLLSIVQTGEHGNAAGLNHFIYGQTAAMSRSDALLMAGIGVVAIIATAVLLKEITLVCFNDEFARVGGWPVTVIDLIVMALVVLVTAAGLQAVGLLLVVALLIIPPVSARFWTDQVRRLVVLAGVFGAMGGYLGSVVSASLPRQPAGAVIVLTSGVLFVVSMTFAPRRGVLATGLKRLRLRLRISGDHLLEAAYEHTLMNRDHAVVPDGVVR